jgi:hypothetical protein
MNFLVGRDLRRSVADPTEIRGRQFFLQEREKNEYWLGIVLDVVETDYRNR